MQILNAHTESLGWIDRETILLKQKVEDVKKIADSRKKEREHTFRSVSGGVACGTWPAVSQSACPTNEASSCPITFKCEELINGIPIEICSIEFSCLEPGGQAPGQPEGIRQVGRQASLRGSTRWAA